MNAAAFSTFRKAFLALGLITSVTGLVSGYITGNAILFDYALYSAIATAIFGVVSFKPLFS